METSCEVDAKHVRPDGFDNTPKAVLSPSKPHTGRDTKPVATVFFPTLFLPVIFKEKNQSLVVINIFILLYVKATAVVKRTKYNPLATRK